MELKHEDYQITCDPETGMVICTGIFRLPGSDYGPITQLLNEVADARPALITLDLQAMEFLNSFGITVLSQFVMRVNKYKASQLVIKGNQKMTWQKKSLRLFPRLMKDLKLELE